MRGILAEIDLRFSTVVGIIAVPHGQELIGLQVIMLINKGNALLIGEFPSLLVIRARRRWSDCPDDGDLRMLRMHGVKDHLPPFAEYRRLCIFITHTQVFQMKGEGMPRSCPPGP